MNWGKCYNYTQLGAYDGEKKKKRARIVTSGNSVALLTFTKIYSLRKLSPAINAALQKTMSRDIIKTGSTKSFLHIRNA